MGWTGHVAARIGSSGKHAGPWRFHRGRHRAPLILQLIPVGHEYRYVAVVGAAVIGAGAVALGSAVALPDGGSPAGTTAADLPPAVVNVEDRRDTFDELAARPPGAIDPEVRLEPRAQRDQHRTDSPMTEQPAERRWVAPLDDFTITSLYGARWGTMHSGVDLGAVTGTPVYAAYPGTVVEAGWSGGYGYLVVIDHGDGVSTLYAHNSALRVEVGRQVLAGDHISDVGNTGFSFGAHLHFEVHVDGQAIDPLPYLDEQGLHLQSAADGIEDADNHA